MSERWSLLGHSLLGIAHVTNAIGAMATLWDRPAFAMTAILLASAQTGIAVATSPNDERPEDASS